MSNKLLQHLRKYIDFPSENETDLLRFFQTETYKKKENLVEQNTKCKYHFFVVKGCLRMFYIDHKGSEQSIQFAIQNWWITDYVAFENQSITEFTIQAVLKTNVLKITYADQELLFKKFPQLERYFRLIHQRAYFASLMRIRYHNDFTREQLFHHFNDHYPEFTQNIPQRLLASYLNMTPEYLSEIKNKPQT